MTFILKECIMEEYGVYKESLICNIRPEGWLRNYLIMQKNGLTGFLPETGYPYNTNCWGKKEFQEGGFDSWWPYEQMAYWIDGVMRCGYLLNDESFIEKALSQIEFTVENPDDDGFLGPSFMKRKDCNNQWPHAVLFRAFAAHVSATGSLRLAEAVRRHYLSDSAAYLFEREIVNIESMLWAYRVTGDRRLLENAEGAYKYFMSHLKREGGSPFALHSYARPKDHGVTYNEVCKLGAVLYLHTGEEEVLMDSVDAFRKLDRFAMLISGVNSSTEHVRGKEPLDAHETCDIADYTWSTGYLLMATGNAEYADKIEKACFNAAPGAVTEDFRAGQYFSCPNQVLATRGSNHVKCADISPRMSYRSAHDTDCCMGEVNRIMPNYVSRMWMLTQSGDPVASLYGPSCFSFNVRGRKERVLIVETTDYPFSECIDFQIRTKYSAEFSLFIRIPSWCSSAKILINGKETGIKGKKGSFVEIRRSFEHNDTVSLYLPMKLKISRWPKGGIGIERGPLVFSLPIMEKRTIDRKWERQSERLPAFEMNPVSAWNYAIIPKVDKFKVEYCFKCGNPWSVSGARIKIIVPAKKVKGWKTVKLKEVDNFGKPAKGNWEHTPDLPRAEFIKDNISDIEERITLVPYGCTTLRMTIFPKALV